MTAISAAFLWWLHLRFAVGPILAWEYSTWPAVATITLYGVCYAQGIRNFARFNLLRISQGIIAGGLMLAGVLAGRLTPAEAGAAYLIPAWSTAVAVVIWLRRTSHADADKPLTRHERRTMWSYGWRSLASLTGLALNRNADQLALGFLVSAGSLGIYNVAESASGPLLDIVKSFGMVGLPAVAALSGAAKSRVTWQTLRRAFYLVALIAPLFAFSFPWAIATIYGAGYSAAVMTAELLLAGAAFASLASVADDLLRAHGRPGSVSLTEGIGGIVTILGVVALKGHPLDAVALVSLLGYAAAFSLAFLRLALVAGKPGAASELRTAEAGLPAMPLP
jgi:O-antigen/teichoic acid export membrane protein